jgi:nucleolin
MKKSFPKTQEKVVATPEDSDIESEQEETHQVSKSNQGQKTVGKNTTLGKREQPVSSKNQGKDVSAKAQVYEADSLSESDENSDEEVAAPVKKVQAKSTNNKQNSNAPAPRKVSQASKKSSMHEEEEVVAPSKKVKVQTIAKESDEVAEEKPAWQNRNQSNDAPKSEPEVIVGGLPFAATENDIKNHFKACKDIVSVKIMMGQDGRPRGKAFIKFTNEEAMNKAIALTNSQVNGRSITVEQTRPREQQPRSNDRFGNQGGNNSGSNQNSGQTSNNIIVRNLSFNVDENSLRSHFSGCGDIKGVRIMLNEEGRSKGFGFVDFFNPESAKSALSKAGEKLDGRQMNIEYSLPRGPGGYQGRPGQGGQGGFGGRPSFGGRGGSSGYNNERKGFVANYTGEQYDL